MFTALVLVWLVACLFAWFLPPRYRSDTTILIEQPQVPQQYVLPNIVPDIQAHLQTLTQQILSRTRLQRIIDDLHLYSSNLDHLPGMGNVIDRMRKDITINLIQTPQKPSEVTAFSVSYSGSNPQLVQEVTSRLTSLFIEENIHARQQQSESTTDFLDRQLQDARTRLEDQGRRIKQFKSQFVGQLPNELTSNLQILSALQAQVQQSNEGLDRAEQQKLYLTSLLNAYRETPSLASLGLANPEGQVDVDTELARLNTELVEMESRYTENHPTVLQIREEIAKAEKLKSAMKNKGHEPMSRAVAELESQLKGTELDIQHRKKEVASLQSQIHSYEIRLNQTPIREQQLADLSGDYDQSRENYDLLLKKRNDSALATDLEKNQEGEQFVVLDPPSLPASPYFPNRLSLTVVGLIAGLAAAFGTAFVREGTDDHIHASNEVSTVSKAPTLVTIPPLISANEVSAAQWRAKKEAVSAAVVLVAMAASTLVAYYYG